MSCGCNSCKSASTECNLPNIIWSECINIDTTDPDNIVISTECNPEVVSNDNSIAVNVSTMADWHKVYDISKECCDKFVWACATDPNPGSLEDKLEVQSPLQIDTINCNTVRLSLDLEAIRNSIDTDTDELVKRDSNCDAVYGRELFTAGDCFKITDNGCSGTIEYDCDVDACSPCAKQFAKIRLTDSILIDQPLQAQTFYLFLGGDQWFSVGDWPFPVSGNITGTYTSLAATFSEEMQYWVQVLNNTLWAPVGFQICRDWVYDLKMRGTIEINWGVNAFRANTFYIPSGTTTIIPLLEERASWPGVEWATAAWDFNPPTNSNLHTNGGAGNYDPAAGLWQYQERHSLNDSDIFRFKAGDIIFFWVKIDTVIWPTAHDMSVPGKVAVLGSNEVAAWWDVWLSLSIHSIDDYCTTSRIEEVAPC